MVSLLYTTCFFLLVVTTTALGQSNLFKPEIIRQVPSPLTTQENQPIAIEFSNLIVVDADPLPVYPTGFFLDISKGNNYKVQGNTITPDKNFAGLLKVGVKVNDGKRDSKKFDLTVEVVKAQNAVPQIIAQKVLETDEDQEITLRLSHLTVTDADNKYPDDFTMEIATGDNYTVSGSKIVPTKNFAGILSVPVKVNDGTIDSPPFNLQVSVKPVNDAPEIIGQVVLTIAQNSTLTIELNHLTVTDPDNKYPDDFSLKVSQGNNYRVSSNSITPSNNFTGELTVKVKVNDGRVDSKSFDLKVQVIENTSAPEITGQTTLNIKEDESITLELSHLSVKGGKNDFPNGFTLLVATGDNYKMTGTTITPFLNYSGRLSVNVKVTDGEKESAPFKLQISVSPVNDPPAITGQVLLTTDKNKSIPMELSNLIVADPDNTYPNGFTLEISPGPNYSVAGKNINPSPTFTGTLEVGAKVNDGLAASNLYKVKINVISTNTNVPPVITAQRPVTITQNSEYSIKLFDITVSDPNNDKKYPEGYTLSVLTGNNYTVKGTTVKATSNFTGSSFIVRITVNDGQDTSPPFDFKIGIVPPSSTPKINGQNDLTISEDSTLLLTLSDLIVSDADNLNYPQGFSLTVLPGNEEIYTAVGNTITPALNLNGYIEVSVSVSDGVNPSEPFNVSILVTPINDPPEIINLEQTPLACEPGREPINISETIDLSDADNEYLSMAEIGFSPTNHSIENDELIFNNNDSSKIRAVYDPEGILFLIGYASINDYRDAIRTILYNYKMTQDEFGDPSEILSGTRTLYLYVHDGQHASVTHERQISMETKVLLDIPTAFTPNGDKANDTWRVQATNKDQVEKSVIRIYDKRGVLLYEDIGFNKEWDGSLNGKVLPMDTYYYTIDLNLSYMKKTYKGAVTILH